MCSCCCVLPSCNCRSLSCLACTEYKALSKKKKKDIFNFIRLLWCLCNNLIIFITVFFFLTPREGTADRAVGYSNEIFYFFFNQNCVNPLWLTNGRVSLSLSFPSMLTAKNRRRDGWLSWPTATSESIYCWHNVLLGTQHCEIDTSLKNKEWAIQQNFIYIYIYI